MLTYASILEKQQYVIHKGIKVPIATGEIVEAACEALRVCAAQADLRWHISDAFCAGCWDCGCSQEEIDAAEGKCWQYADRMLAHLAKQKSATLTLQKSHPIEKIEGDA